MDWQSLKPYFVFDLKRIFYRILRSFQFWINRVDVDIYGSIPLFLLFLILSSDPNSKINQISLTHPYWVIMEYHLLISIIVFLLSKWGKSHLNFLQVFGLIGYAFYAYFFLILIYLSPAAEEFSATTYFILVFVVLFFSTAKLLRIFVSRTRVTGMRLLVCSAACIPNALFFLYVFLVYIHPDFSHPNITPK